MRLPTPANGYDIENEAQTRQIIEAEDAKNQKRGGYYDVGKNGRFTLTSPNGTVYVLTIDNAGTATWAAL